MVVGPDHVAGKTEVADELERGRLGGKEAVGTGLDRAALDVLRLNDPAESRTRFDDAGSEAALGKVVRGRKPRDPAADDNYLHENLNWFEAQCWWGRRFRLPGTTDARIRTETAALPAGGSLCVHYLATLWNAAEAERVRALSGRWPRLRGAGPGTRRRQDRSEVDKRSENRGGCCSSD